MKYVKVTITKETNLSLPRMAYPSSYNAKAVDDAKQGPLVYNQGIAKGGTTEEMVMYVEDRLADIYATDPAMEILSEAQVDTWLGAVTRVQEQPEERVTDVDRMHAIQAKVAAGISLSTEDLDALDPDKPVRGINRKPRTAAGIFRGA